MRWLTYLIEQYAKFNPHTNTGCDKSWKPRASNKGLFQSPHPYRVRHPIPITAEILEMNGLYRHLRDDYNPKLIALTNHFIMARTYTDVDWWRVLIYDEEIPSEELFNGIIYSVHQLQHALRLAGVDKEINL